MGNGIARVVIERRKLGVIESPFPQRKVRVEDGIEEGTSKGLFDGHNNSGSSIHVQEAPMPQHQPWSEFTAANLLPSSVYLWACDERQPGESRPSRSDALVAWIVLITQMFCYIQLMVVSSTKGHKDDTTNSSSANEGTSESTNGRISPTANGGSYSLVSVAAAMYLMTSIASADLSAGIALLSEARSEMTTSRWIQRKTFGLMLLASFVLLAAASIKVLFYSSSEDVDLVVGAATVLFIADVDEKVMVVLKVIPSEWRLFFVLEVIGLSGSFALLGLRATGNGDEVVQSDQAGCNYWITKGLEDECFIYSWSMILNYIPLSVTVVSLLLNTIVISPGRFMARHVLKKSSYQDWIFVLLLALWILDALQRYVFFSYELPLNSKVLFLAIYATGLVAWGLFATYKRVFRQDSDWSTARYVCFRWSSSITFGLFYIPTVFFLLGVVMIVTLIKLLETGSEIDILDPVWDPYLVTEALLSVLFQIWVLWGVSRKGGHVMTSSPTIVTVAAEQEECVTEPQGGFFRQLSPPINLLLGWVHANALVVSYYVSLSEVVSPHVKRTGEVWTFLLVLATYSGAWYLTGVSAAVSKTKGVAFWAVMTGFLDEVGYCVWIFTKAARKGTIK